jgi:hypothetical protein
LINPNFDIGHPQIAPWVSEPLGKKYFLKIFPHKSSKKLDIFTSFRAGYHQESGQILAA